DGAPAHPAAFLHDGRVAATGTELVSGVPVREGDGRRQDARFEVVQVRPCLTEAAPTTASLRQVVRRSLVVRHGDVVDPIGVVSEIERLPLGVGVTGRTVDQAQPAVDDRKSTRLNSSHVKISYAVFCLKK